MQILKEKFLLESTTWLITLTDSAKSILKTQLSKLSFKYGASNFKIPITIYYYAQRYEGQFTGKVAKFWFAKRSYTVSSF